MREIYIKIFEKWIIEPKDFNRILVPAISKISQNPIALWLEKNRVKGFFDAVPTGAWVKYETDNADFYMQKIEAREKLDNLTPIEVEVLKPSKVRAKNFSRMISDWNWDIEGFIPPLLIEQYYHYYKTNIHPDLGVLD